MNDFTPPASDPLEDELSSLRPAAPSADLHDRVARALAGRTGKPRFGLWLAAGGFAAAACIVIGAAVALRGVRTPRTDSQHVTINAPGTALAPAPDHDGRPALVTYRRALSRSPADLDELLDRHASTSFQGDVGRSPVRTRVTAGSDFSFLR